ncbi:hypothetical protein HW555_007168 [Spodoptera exigua]|uniref:Uncharacterized protein n=1 Tax=Spodoptera exigua TaxID=7107 RepID=A0A835GGI3_SPOEX|nr:hypothetical protein HW555_007168 [Spodoptera exigua]
MKIDTNLFEFEDDRCQPVLPKWLVFLLGGSGNQGRKAGGAKAAATRAADDGGDHRKGTSHERRRSKHRKLN